MAYMTVSKHAAYRKTRTRKNKEGDINIWIDVATLGSLVVTPEEARILLADLKREIRVAEDLAQSVSEDATEQIALSE